MSSDAKRETRQGRRWRWQWFLQFNLRTLLIAVTLAGCACWWFLRPQTLDEDLAGGELKLHRQVRTKEGRMSYALGSPWYQMPQLDFEHCNVGMWQLRNGQNELLVDGRFAENEPHGGWEIYHANGRLASQGSMYFGAKTGVWRAWDDEGCLRSETAYVATKVVRPNGGMGLPSGPRQVEGYVSQRHGPVRAWYSNGTPKIQGEYLHDLRHGLWTLTDDEGRVTARGEYRADEREGSWTLCDEAGNLREVHYKAGRIEGNRN